MNVQQRVLCSLILAFLSMKIEAFNQEETTQAIV